MKRISMMAIYMRFGSYLKDFFFGVEEMGRYFWEITTEFLNGQRGIKLSEVVIVVFTELKEMIIFLFCL